VEGAVGTAVLGSGVLSEAEFGFAVEIEAVPDILASSTSPSSTSVGFGVGTPRELNRNVSDNKNADRG
jgi:hypothetical protein